MIIEYSIKPFHLIDNKAELKYLPSHYSNNLKVKDLSRN